MPPVGLGVRYCQRSLKVPVVLPVLLVQAVLSNQSLQQLREVLLVPLVRRDHSALEFLLALVVLPRLLSQMVLGVLHCRGYPNFRCFQVIRRLQDFLLLQADLRVLRLLVDPVLRLCQEFQKAL